MLFQLKFTILFSYQTSFTILVNQIADKEFTITWGLGSGQHCRWDLTELWGRAAEQSTGHEKNGAKHPVPQAQMSGFGALGIGLHWIL